MVESRPSPILAGLLARARARLAGIVLLHGAASTMLAALGWLLVAYLLDRSLELPAAIRLFHLLLFAAIPLFVLWREWWRPWRARPRDEELAVLVERAHPSLASVLVSAVQLERRPEGSRELVAATVARAEAAARGLDLAGVFDPSKARQRLRWSFAALAAVALVGWLDAQGARIFLARIAGAEVSWPRRTELVLEIRAGTPVDPADPLVRRVARGSDVPVVVVARGETPEEVVLHDSSGRRQVLAATARGNFGALVRGVSQDVELWATGGDDQDEGPKAKLIVLVPPDVAGVALEIEPPAYAKLASSLSFDGAAKALQGSRVRVHVLPSPPDARGVARLEPDGRALDLAPARYPADTESAPAKQGLSFEFVAEATTRFRFELTDSNGLSNPDPGLHGIDVIEDKAPRIELSAPARSDLDTTAQGLVALRARIEDDFGVAQVELSCEPVEGDPLLVPLEAARLDPATLASERPASELPRDLRAVVRRLEAAELFAPGACAPGAACDLVVVAHDIKEPQPRTTRSQPVRLRVLSDDEFLRRIQDRLTRAQGSATSLAELLRSKESEWRELETVLAAAVAEETSAAVSAAAAGARRVQGEARSLARELCSTAEAILLARIEERALAAVAQLDGLSSDARRADLAGWTRLAEQATGGAFGNGLAPKLVEIAALSASISEIHATEATEALAGAESSNADAQAATAQALRSTRSALEETERLLSKLAEWDTLQSVLNLTRDILEAQKNLAERTKQGAQAK